MQKEREAEGEEFADKEAFVTGSYIKKMEELKTAEEEAKLEELQEGRLLCGSGTTCPSSLGNVWLWYHLSFSSW